MGSRGCFGLLGFLIVWLVNSTIVAVIAGFQSGEMSLGQWVMAGGGGLVLGSLEVKLLELPFRKQDQVLRAGPGTSPSSGRFIFDKYGVRYEVTDTAIEVTVRRPFGDRRRRLSLSSRSMRSS